MVIALFLVFFGFFVVFFSSAIDFMTTYLPENLVKSSIPIGFIGWALESLFTQNITPFFTSLKFTLLSFLFGGILYYSKHWASGDMWLMAVASSLLSPAFINFWPDFFVYTLIWSGILGIFYYIYFFITSKIYKKYFKFILLVLLSGVYTIFNLNSGLFLLALTFLLLVLASRKDIDDLFIIEKKVKNLEEDDWLIEDLKLGKYLVKASSPIGIKEVKLAKKYGKGNLKIKSGVPMTPAFSLALLSLLFV